MTSVSFSDAFLKGKYMKLKKNDDRMDTDIGEVFMSGCRLGTCFCKNNGINICIFRVYAPHADKVYLCADFCGWEKGIPMVRGEDGVWEVSARDVGIYDCYKYRIEANGRSFYKADPYAFHAETPPGTASKIYDISGFGWQDVSWMEARKCFCAELSELPLNIYELHLGSWKRKDNGDVYSYREIAGEIASYVKRMGYTHVKLMPMFEHMDTASCGYLPTSLFAPTSRFGTPHDFMYFIDVLHRSGTGVILDIPFGSFSKDEHGLYRFDSTPLYERCDDSSDGTAVFDTDSECTVKMLEACVLFWINVYHIDGVHLICDASEMPGFLSGLCKRIKCTVPDVLVISEDRNDFADLVICRDIVKDALACFGRGAHGIGTFLSCTDKCRMTDALLPLCIGDSLMDGRMVVDAVCGDYFEKLSSLKALVVFLMTLPGKKLTFMGNEIGQCTPWNFSESVGWRLLQYDVHKKIATFFSDINSLYLSKSELFGSDEKKGLLLLNVDCTDDNIVAYIRYDTDGSGLLCIVNFGPRRHGVKINVPQDGIYSRIFCSEDETYSTDGSDNGSTVLGASAGIGGKRDCFVIVDIPERCGMIFSVKTAAKKSKRVLAVNGKTEKKISGNAHPRIGKTEK